MNKLSISQLFAAVVGLAIALVLFIVWFSSSEMKQLSLESKQSISQAVEPMTDLAKIGVEVQRTRVNLRDYLLSSQIGQTPDKQAEFKKRYHQLSDKINERINHLSGEIKTPEEKQLMGQIQQQWNVLLQVVKDIEQAIESNNHTQATEFMLTRCYAAAAKLTDSLYQLDAELENVTKDTLDHQLSMAEKTTQQMLWISAGGLILFLGTVAVVWTVVKNLKQSLVAAMLISQRIAKGDLTNNIDVKTHDEGGMLLKSLSEMLHGLRTTVSSVIDGAHKVGQASEQLVQSSKQLGDSASVQAASASNTTHAVNEFSASVQTVADSATGVTNMAEDSLKQTEDSRQKISILVDEISRVETAIQHISESVGKFITSSREIAQMTEQVKEIADQTNLLALNAAIEAARAGEQGRGFAVVADEVRQLAEKSASSASQISEITSSVAKQTELVEHAVKQGFDSINASRTQADQAVQAIAETRNGVEGAVHAVSNISKQVREQSHNANHMAQNIKQIADMIDKTKQSVIETDQTTQELRQVANTLRTSVSGFKLS